jgi:hypothetical protein
LNRWSKIGLYGSMLCGRRNFSSTAEFLVDLAQNISN